MRYVYALIGIFLLMSMLYSVSATEQSLGTFAQNTCVELRQICGNCTYNNITSVTYPNSSLALSSADMTKIGTAYNYTFCSTSLLGDYIVQGFGDPDTIPTVWTYDFVITVSGKQLSVSNAIAYVIILIAAIFIFILSLIGAIKIPWKNARDNEGKVLSINNLKHLKVALCFVSYLLLMWIIFIIYGISNNFMTLNIASNIFYMLGEIMLYALYPLMIAVAIIILVTFLNDRKLNKAMLRGFNPR